MDKLISDKATDLISEMVKSVLQDKYIADWQSEPYYQHQNFCEKRYKTIKRWVNIIMDRSGCPADCWLLCLEYTVYLLNRISTPSLNGKNPFTVLTGRMADISTLLHFHFYQPVYYKAYNDVYPKDSP